MENETLIQFLTIIAGTGAIELLVQKLKNKWKNKRLLVLLVSCAIAVIYALCKTFIPVDMQLAIWQFLLLCMSSAVAFYELIIKVFAKTT